MKRYNLIPFCQSLCVADGDCHTVPGSSFIEYDRTLYYVPQNSIDYYKGLCSNLFEFANDKMLEFFFEKREQNKIIPFSLPLIDVCG